ncbi:Flp family type IVb pilin [Halomonas sp. Y3]|uniref:Flp family type IVb pilin n=1 Tax=Halomonas sp. Y3 TaxID=2956797 RepID=UPI0020A1CE77|nr:Flp family type IVb pilin [Halomonas sp. Y3]
MSPIQRMTQLIQRGHAEASATLNTAASRRQRGASAIEYVIIAAVIAFAIFAVAGIGDDSLIGSAFKTFFDQIADIVTDSTGGEAGGT